MFMEMLKQCRPITKVEILGEGHIALASSTETSHMTILDSE